MNQPLTYLLASLCLLPMTSIRHNARSTSAQGVQVLLGGSCPEGMESGSRLLAVRYLPDGRYFLNDQEATQAQVRQLLRPLLEHRIERLVWVAADKDVAYGNVVSLLSNLHHDTPHLYIAIATRSQVGPSTPSRSSMSTTAHRMAD